VREKGVESIACIACTAWVEVAHGVSAGLVRWGERHEAGPDADHDSNLMPITIPNWWRSAFQTRTQPTQFPAYSVQPLNTSATGREGPADARLPPSWLNPFHWLSRRPGAGWSSQLAPSTPWG